MHEMIRLPLLTGLLLFAVAPMAVAVAEGPLLPDPVPPAVVGRPLEQIKPARPVREKPAAAKPAAAQREATRPPTAAMGAGVPQVGASNQRPAKQALDDRADTTMLADDVGKGTHFARKPLAPGAYISDKYRAAVRKYFEAHPPRGAAARWRIGEPVPRGAPVRAVPAGLLASLPELPPGHRYLQLGRDVVLVAEGSNMVVDGVSRSTTQP